MVVRTSGSPPEGSAVGPQNRASAILSCTMDKASCDKELSASTGGVAAGPGPPQLLSLGPLESKLPGVAAGLCPPLLRVGPSTPCKHGLCEVQAKTCAESSPAQREAVQGGTDEHAWAATQDAEASQLPLAKLDQRRFLRPVHAGTLRMAVEAGTGADPMMLLKVIVCSVTSSR